MIPETEVFAPAAARRQASSTILPMCSPLSMRAWAAAASTSGKARSITGRRRPASTSGHTCVATARANAVLKASLRERSVYPVWVSRFSIRRRKSTVALKPPWNAICTMRPSGAAAS